MRETGYGSGPFLRACEDAKTSRAIPGSGTRVAWRRLRTGGFALTWYRVRLPAVRVRPTTSSAGQMIAEHFAIRDEGQWRFRRAQGVLTLPEDLASYLRGRHRQAVRTNVNRAREAGLTVESRPVEGWEPGAVDTRAGQITAGPVERWLVLDAEGEIVADSILSVDEDVALLHGLVSSVTYARWLLHTAIVERLCGRCRFLLTNSDDAYLMGAGNQHFQRLLGYEIARLRLSRSTPAPPDRAALLQSLAEVDLQGDPAA